jgi:hypothetical protein
MEKAITLQPYAIATDKPKVLREKINETAQMQYRLKKD